MFSLGLIRKIKHNNKNNKSNDRKDNYFIIKYLLYKIIIIINLAQLLNFSKILLIKIKTKLIIIIIIYSIKIIITIIIYSNKITLIIYLKLIQQIM